MASISFLLVLWISFQEFFKCVKSDLLVLFIQAFVLVRSSATVEFQFLRWSNPDHSELDGGCCDPGWSCGSCDNYFIVCLDDDVPGSNNFDECGIRSTTTDVVFVDNDEFDFPSPIPSNIPNPQATNVASWQGQMRVKLRVMDSDDNDDDTIEEAFKNIVLSSFASQSSAQWVQYTMGTHSDFTFQVRVYCNADSYTSDCSVYCVPTDNQNGHYTCNPTTGAKMCYDGWEGIL
ncbi:delta-like protein A [Patiria miniata]|uniref:DSL domain-containing protein n=1 Tax=Patiria miniata TaxID=46514 RepID=A0A914BLM3_PATMI|nr:delta-like protein A [Patiria miniata]